MKSIIKVLTVVCTVFLMSSGVHAQGVLQNDYAIDFLNNCDFGAPSVSEIPTIKETYSHIYIIEDNQITKSDLKSVKFDWNKQKNKFKKLNIVTKLDQKLMVKTSSGLNQGIPSIFIKNNPIPVLQGKFYPVMDNDNLVLVSTTDQLTIYLSKSNQVPQCRNFQKDIVEVDYSEYLDEDHSF